MTALLIRYARCSTDQQDLTAQRDGLLAMGVDPARIYVDHGLTGTNRDRPGLREALAACREGDTLVVTKLDRLARSLPDARAIADELTAQVRLNLGGSVYDPNDAVGRLLFNVLAMVAEFSDLIRLRTREGMKVAMAKGRLRGKKPKLNPRQEAHLVALFATGEHSTAELADLFGVGRSTVYRAVERANPRQPDPRLPVISQPATLRGTTGSGASGRRRLTASGSASGAARRRSEAGDVAALPGRLDGPRVGSARARRRPLHERARRPALPSKPSAVPVLPRPRGRRSPLWTSGGCWEIIVLRPGSNARVRGARRRRR